MERNNELIHYGIPGMRWGHRKAVPATSVDRARSNYRQAKKDYNRSFNKAYNRALSAYSPSKKQRKANDARWDKAASDARKLKETKSVYKAEKKQFKSDVKQYRKSKGVYDLNVNKNGAVVATSKASKVKDSISAKKGKAYADKVVKTGDKKDRRVFVAQYAASGAMIATGAYLYNRGSR